MTVMRNRMKKLAMKTREEIMATPRMAMKREARKEDKALKAALLDNAIETELFERLKKGIYPQQPVGMNILEEDIDPLVEFVVGDVELEKELEDDIEDCYGLPTKTSHHDGDDVYDKKQVVIHKKTRPIMKSDDKAKKKKNKSRMIVEVEGQGGDDTWRKI
ncbi:unnamed protein product [Cochlearia groenlandica]